MTDWRSVVSYKLTMAPVMFLGKKRWGAETSQHSDCGLLLFFLKHLDVVFISRQKEGMNGRRPIVVNHVRCLLHRWLRSELVSPLIQIPRRRFFFLLLIFPFAFFEDSSPFSVPVLAGINLEVVLGIFQCRRAKRMGMRPRE